MTKLNNATVDLPDPTKGYYISRKGTNDVSVFINRTPWEQAEIWYIIIKG